MRKLSNIMGSDVFRALALLILCFIGLEKPAAAYVDPGSGALVWQLIAAALVGMAFQFRRIKARIAGRFGRSQRDA